MRLVGTGSTFMNSLMKISGNHSFSAAMWSLLMPHILLGSTWWMNCTRSYLAPGTMPFCAFTSKTDRIKMLTQVGMLWLMTEQKPFCQTLPDNRPYPMLVKAWKTDGENVSSSLKLQAENEAEKGSFPMEPGSFYLPLLGSSLETQR